MENEYYILKDLESSYSGSIGLTTNPNEAREFKDSYDFKDFYDWEIDELEECLFQIITIVWIV